MYRKFNCGMGYAIAVDPDYGKDVIKQLELHGAAVIGSAYSEVPSGNGEVVIQNPQFQKGRVIFE